MHSPEACGNEMSLHVKLVLGLPYAKTLCLVYTELKRLVLMDVSLSRIQCWEQKHGPSKKVAMRIIHMKLSVC